MHTLTVNELLITDQISFSMSLSPDSRALRPKRPFVADRSRTIDLPSAPPAEIPCQTFDGGTLSLPRLEALDGPMAPLGSFGQRDFATLRRDAASAFHNRAAISPPQIRLPRVPTQGRILDDLSSGTLKKPIVSSAWTRQNDSLIVLSRGSRLQELSSGKPLSGGVLESSQHRWHRPSDSGLMPRHCYSRGTMALLKPPVEATGQSSGWPFVRRDAETSTSPYSASCHALVLGTPSRANLLSHWPSRKCRPTRRRQRSFSLSERSRPPGTTLGRSPIFAFGRRMNRGWAPEPELCFGRGSGSTSRPGSVHAASALRDPVPFA
ncbi:hypothetical protein FDECE_8196 [Fusarium decemcellulare]|nr:hypothetical protein FDECE_8196 [Fusarium decemcellulare]